MMMMTEMSMGQGLARLQNTASSSRRMAEDWRSECRQNQSSLAQRMPKMRRKMSLRSPPQRGLAAGAAVSC